MWWRKVTLTEPKWNREVLDIWEFKFSKEMNNMIKDNIDVFLHKLKQGVSYQLPGLVESS